MAVRKVVIASARLASGPKNRGRPPASVLPPELAGRDDAVEMFGERGNQPPSARISS